MSSVCEQTMPETAAGIGTPLLELRGVKKYFPVKAGLIRRRVGDVRAVDGVSFALLRGETLGVVGESGCGKSTLGRVITRIHDPTAGRILLDGRDITHLRGRELRALRRRFQMVFQDPYASLNPHMSVGAIVGEPMIVHRTVPRGEVPDRVVAVLETVGLFADARMRYPHEFSGGQRQRIAIARALAARPQLIVADEAVAALDVSVQAQILNLLADLRAQSRLSYVFISHNLAAIQRVSDRVAVMYMGRIVEYAAKSPLYDRPLHPYTEALLSAALEPKRHARRERIVLAGEVPSPVAPPSGCVFHTRCPKVMDICRSERPQLLECGVDHLVACHLYCGGIRENLGGFR